MVKQPEKRLTWAWESNHCLLDDGRDAKGATAATGSSHQIDTVIIQGGTDERQRLHPDDIRHRGIFA